MKPFISICIPAYKNTAYLDVLLQSVKAQTFRNYEVIVSDDSPNDEVEDLCKIYATVFPLQYHKNSPAKGSPANWNQGIALAKGEWIKIMHDDDWFADEHSLEKFAKVANDHPGVGFIFSGYSNFENGILKKVSIPGSFVESKLKRSALCLFAKNYIGAPSTTLIRNDRNDWYDVQTKWVVDFEFYIRCLTDRPFYIIHESLINVGFNEEQITKVTFGNRDIEIPENIYILNKMGTAILKNMAVYNHYWRLFRNLSVRSIGEVQQSCGNNSIPEAIKKMLQMQFKVPLSILRIGIFSRLLMIISFYTN